MRHHFFSFWILLYLGQFLVILGDVQREKKHFIHKFSRLM